MVTISRSHAPHEPKRVLSRDDGDRSLATRRCVAALVALACLGLLVAGASIRPAAAGHGTHTQLGMPPCTWAVAFGRPCVTCGMTTAVAHAARFDLPAAFRAQPFGALVALLAAAAFWIALHAAITGADAWRHARVLFSWRAAWVWAGLAGLAWAYKWATWT